MIDKFELVYNAFKNKPSDEKPISLWKHFPYEDRAPEGLEKATIRFHEKFPGDLIKFSPHGRYCVVDWGCEINAEVDPISGSTNCKKCVISSKEDWETIEELDPQEGEFGRQLQALRGVTNVYGNKVPIMMTIFSPFMVASKIDPNILEHIKDASNTVLDGLKEVSKTMIEFAKSSIDEGANGLFIATQHSRDILSLKQFEQYEVAPMRHLMSSVTKKEFTVIHIHGLNIYFKEIATKLQPDAINWHDQETPPTLQDAPKEFSGGLLAGMGARVKLRTASPQETRQYILKILENTCNQHIMAPGCVIPLDVSDENIEIVLNTVKEFQPNKK
ncbi:MAG: uroporphyrinogen decarboxylase family protein [Candidatus Hodarchaeota archaeon]